MDSLDDIFAPLKKTGGAVKQPLDELFAPITPGGIAPPSTFRGAMQFDKDVDYNTGAPIGARYDMFKASNPAEQKLVLDRHFGEGNYRKDPNGSWVVKQGDKWTALYPRGVGETAKTMGAGAAAMAPQIIGPAVGGAVAGPAGSLASVLGAVGGSVGAYGLEEGVKGLRGLFDKSPGETLGEGGIEALSAGAFQGAGPLKNRLANSVYGGTSAAARKLFTVNPEGQATAQGLQRFGADASPPLVSVLPRAKAFEFDRAMRNQISGDPKAAGRVRVVDARMGEVLQRFGLQGPQLDSALNAIKSNSAKLSPQEANQPILDALKGTEDAVRGDAERYVKAGKDALDQHFRAISSSVGPSSKFGNQGLDKDLGKKFATEYENSAKQFRGAMNSAYGNASRAAGDAPVIQLDAGMINGMDPLTLPTQIRNLTQMSDDGVLEFRPLTHLEAHRLRTWMRDQAGVASRPGDQSPMGQRAGDFYRMAGQVDEAMGEAAARDPRMAVARDLLKDADKQYKEGVTRYTNDQINNTVFAIRQGRQPDPDRVATLLLNKDSAASAKQMWDILSPELKQKVETADLYNMVNAAAKTGRDGKKTMDPDALLAAIDERKFYASFVHGQRDAEGNAVKKSGKPMLDELRRMALDYKALHGQIDISDMPKAGLGTSSAQIRDSIARGLEARQELERQATANPAASLRSDNPDLVQSGARYWLKNEARTTAARDTFGETSPEWQSVKKYALLDLLQSGIVNRPLAKSEGIGRTVGGGALDASLGRYTEKQQQALFAPDVLADVKLLVKEANLLFPELRHETGTSMTAANVMGNIASKKGLKAWGYYQAMGKLADSPQLLKLVTGTIRQDPYEGRGLLLWLAQGGLEAHRTDQRPNNADPAPSEFSRAMQPVKKPALPPSFGGPMQ